MIKLMLAPCTDVKFIPTGRINQSNLYPYFSAEILPLPNDYITIKQTSDSMVLYLN